MLTLVSVFRAAFISFGKLCWTSYIYNPIQFLKTSPTKFAATWVKKRQEAGFLRPISSKITLAKEKERKNTKSEEEERSGKRSFWQQQHLSFKHDKFTAYVADVVVYNKTQTE